MDLTLVILGIILVLVLYYFLSSSGTTVLSNKLDLSIPQTSIPKEKVSEPSSRKYSYEMWLYVYNFNGSSNYIISRSASSGSGKNIGLKIDSSSPKLMLEYTATGSIAGSTSATKTISITDNFPLQTWVHLIVSVDDKYIDVYMNGKLIKSIQDSIDTPSATATIDYGIVNCYLAKLSRSMLPTDPQTAWDKYSAGNGENPFAKYVSSFGLTMTLKKNDQDYSKVTLF